ncbi:MAG: hypothetical protein IPO63_02280 [Bacteroidetes bacterium]|nr:hypothetical protein [Bacteroidota bacterium]
MKKSVRVMYHFFAITGVISSFFFLVSWSDAKVDLKESPHEIMAMAPDVNISSESASAFINAYGKRFIKEGNEAPPKGYFISRASISWLLENANLNGIYVYPAVNAQGIVCSIVEGGISRDATHRILEGVAGRVIMSESPCPNDCGSLIH